MRIRYLMRSRGGGAKGAAVEGLDELAVPHAAGESGGKGERELGTEKEDKSTRRDDRPCARWLGFERERSRETAG